jgi:hypothetical protein
MARAPAPVDAAISSRKSDVRALRVQFLPAADAEIRDKAAEVLQPFALTSTAFDHVVAELRGLASDANAVKLRLIEAGRRLLRLEAAATLGGYKALLKAGLVPFSEGWASKLRTVARAVDEKRLPEEKVPRALNAAYLAARLPEPSARVLVDGGVIRPDVSVREMRDAVQPNASSASPSRLPAAERDKLETRRQEIRAEIAALRAELTRIEARLNQP